jgi:hypothetical protein
MHVHQVEKQYFELSWNTPWLVWYNDAFAIVATIFLSGQIF